jgi:Helix-turn-helix domain
MLVVDAHLPNLALRVAGHGGGRGALIGPGERGHVAERPDDPELPERMRALHHRFKAVTAMSPLQYQKHLRMHEARRLMFTDGIECATAGYRVGYESPSQFSREYRRLFGAPPRETGVEA